MTQAPVDDVTRLVNVQSRVRALIQTHAWFADALRSAFTNFVTLWDRCGDVKGEIFEKRQVEARHRARQVLESGRLVDSGLHEGEWRFPQRIFIHGLCPAGLAQRLGLESGTRLSRELEAESAAAALKALDLEMWWRRAPESRRLFLEDDELDEMRPEFVSALRDGTHVPYEWILDVAVMDQEEGPDPMSLDPANLGRFEDRDYVTIAMFRLGGLADLGAHRQIVLAPAPSGDMAWVLSLDTPRGIASRSVRTLTTAGISRRIRGIYPRTRPSRCWLMLSSGSRAKPRSRALCGRPRSRTSLPRVSRGHVGPPSQNTG